MALKDNSQLVKMYAMVNVQQYDAVATGSTVEECVDNYIELLAERGITTTTPGVDGEVTEASGTVADVRSAVSDGNTVIYIRFEGGEQYYTISAAEAPEAVILNPGDEVTVHFSASTAGDTLVPLTGIEITSRAPLDADEPAPPEPSAEPGHRGRRGARPGRIKQLTERPSGAPFFAPVPKAPSIASQPPVFCELRTELLPVARSYLWQLTP